MDTPKWTQKCLKEKRPQMDKKMDKKMDTIDKILFTLYISININLKGGYYV